MAVDALNGTGSPRSGFDEVHKGFSELDVACALVGKAIETVLRMDPSPKCIRAVVAAAVSLRLGGGRSPRPASAGCTDRDAA